MILSKIILAATMSATVLWLMPMHSNGHHPTHGHAVCDHEHCGTDCDHSDADHAMLTIGSDVSSDESTSDSMVQLFKKKCKDCNGKGKTNCNMCGGSGTSQDKCTACGGTGIEGLRNGKLSAAKCPTCKGKKKAPCYGCGGTGKVTCYSCNGTGKEQ